MDMAGKQMEHDQVAGYEFSVYSPINVCLGGS